MKNGYHYLKLLEDTADTEYPVVYALCSNGYVMIDHSIDENWSSYFSSWDKYHYAVSGPSRSDRSNWAEWFLPNAATIEFADDDDREITNTGTFLVAPQCSACVAEAEFQLNAESSAYYLGAPAFGCFNAVRGWPACDMDFESYSCKICEWDDEKTQISSYSRPVTMTYEQAQKLSLRTGACDFEIRTSVEVTPDSFSQCARGGETDHADNKKWKPSLGLDGRFCQCWMPEASTSVHEVTSDQYNEALFHRLQASHLNSADADETQMAAGGIYQIYAEDFRRGTYRITRSGTYLIMEDIELNFNAPPEGSESPNNYEENYWWPTEEQTDEYPGAMGTRDAYFLGFFAGITVEADDVVLDLQGHEIRMARSFYYQQPYFSIIELESQPFLPQQGPGFFGSDPVFASNVVIKNGVLGLSSHHGIHGNRNNDITIEGLRVRDFQTHGIQLNGFNGLRIRDCDIGPNSNVAYLNGNYAHMRLIMPTLKKVAEDSDSLDQNTIVFSGRKNGVTMWDLLDKLMEEMDMAFDFAVNGREGEGESWDEAVRMFLNPSGLPMGAVTYGLFLNYPSAGIFGWHVNDQLSFDAVVENVVIHDLRHRGIEVVGFKSNQRVISNAFDGPLPALDLFGEENVDEIQRALGRGDAQEVAASYAGSLITDIHIAHYFWGKDDFALWPGIPYLGNHDKMMGWATGTEDSYIADDSDILKFSCNTDAMAHPSKGLIAMKVSGVNGLSLDNVTVQRLQDESPLGSDLCGHKDKYHFLQQAPYQIGYSMNMVMGITMDFVTEATMTDTTIEYLSSDSGLAFGVAAWFESEIAVNGALTVREISGGVGIDDDRFSYSSRPNKAAESCSIRLYDDEAYPLAMKWGDDLVVSQQCIEGAVGCLGNSDFTLFGEIDDGDTECSNALVFDYAPDTVQQRDDTLSGAMDAVQDRTLSTSLAGHEVASVSLISSVLLIWAVLVVKALCDCWRRQSYKALSDGIERVHWESDGR